jgi:hemoglobin
MWREQREVICFVTIKLSLSTLVILPSLASAFAPTVSSWRVNTILQGTTRADSADEVAKAFLMDQTSEHVEQTQAERENEKKVHLLEKIGGPAALEAAVEIFYEKIVADPNVAKFFDGVDMDKLKAHQRDFLTLALTEVPEGVDVPKMMDTKHSRFFKQGLNETHFDHVAGHLVATLDGLQVRKDYIDEVVAIVGPLRAVFEQGAKAAQAEY